MDIKQIVDKIIYKSDILERHYTVEERLADIHQERLALIEEAVQIGAREAISSGEIFTEVHNIVAGDNVITRTIPDVAIVKVEYTTATSPMEKDWKCIERDRSCGHSCFCIANMKFTANEKQLFITSYTNAQIRITLQRGAINEFVLADYNAPIPPSPTWLPETFHPMLWLKPAIDQSGNFKKERYEQMMNQYMRLKQLFRNHYIRLAELNHEIQFESEPNYR